MPPSRHGFRAIPERCEETIYSTSIYPTDKRWPISTNSLIDARSYLSSQKKHSALILYTGRIIGVSLKNNNDSVVQKKYILGSFSTIQHRLTTMYSLIYIEVLDLLMKPLNTDTQTTCPPPPPWSLPGSSYHCPGVWPLVKMVTRYICGFLAAWCPLIPADNRCPVSPADIKAQ